MDAIATSNFKPALRSTYSICHVLIVVTSTTSFWFSTNSETPRVFSPWPPVSRMNFGSVYRFAASSILNFVPKLNPFEQNSVSCRQCDSLIRLSINEVEPSKCRPPSVTLILPYTERLGLPETDEPSKDNNSQDWIGLTWGAKWMREDYTYFARLN
jgi:hypothetical protein